LLPFNGKRKRDLANDDAWIRIAVARCCALDRRLADSLPAISISMMIDASATIYASLIW
jgi:hypothetical protein